MRATPKARMKKRNDRYFIGYLDRLNPCLSSRWGFAYAGLHKTSGAEPMTLREAQRLLAEMPCNGCAIFELVPVRVNG